jgi:hypothetical protein
VTFEWRVNADIQQLSQTGASARYVDHLYPQLLDPLDDRCHNMAWILVKD